MDSILIVALSLFSAALQLVFPRVDSPFSPVLPQDVLRSGVVDAHEAGGPVDAHFFFGDELNQFESPLSGNGSTSSSMTSYLVCLAVGLADAI